MTGCTAPWLPSQGDRGSCTRYPSADYKFLVVRRSHEAAHRPSRFLPNRSRRRRRRPLSFGAPPSRRSGAFGNGLLPDRQLGFRPQADTIGEVAKSS